MDKEISLYAKRPLYVFDLPEELLASLKPKCQSDLDAKDVGNGQSDAQDVSKKAVSCGLCGVDFKNFTDQRRHMRSDWHNYNLRQKTNGLATVGESEFERLIEDLDLSISGSEASSSEDEVNDHKGDVLSSLLKKQARVNDPKVSSDEAAKQSKPRGTPLLWFSSSKLPPQMSLGVYKALFSQSEQEITVSVEALQKRQLDSVMTQGQSQIGSNAQQVRKGATGPRVFLCMIGGGHFAGMVVSLTPKVVKNSSGHDERQAIVIAHKTFHRYTTRRKQGGSQSANDSSKGNAHSAGAGIRRHNEAALELEVRQLLAEWKTMIQECELLFLRATGSTNRKTLFGQYEGQPFRQNDSRIRSFPFSTRRATQSELMRAFVELTRVKVSEKVKAPEQSTQKQGGQRQRLEKGNNEDPKSSAPKPTKEEEEAMLHTSQLQALIRRSKAPAVISYLKSNSLSPNFAFYPPTSNLNYHSPTPLHMASSTNAAAVVLALLTKAGSDPTIPNEEGKVPFDVAGERATRDMFRIARSELGENALDWQKAHCPAPISKAEIDRRAEDEQVETQRIEDSRRKAEMARLSEVDISGSNRKTTSGPNAVTQEMTAEDRRELEGRGMTPEMRTKLERERRARAAEGRLKRMAGK